MIRGLFDNRDEALRTGLRTLLASLGKTALPLVTHALRIKSQPPEICRSLLLVLAGMREAPVYELAAGFLAADHPRVREAALVAVARIDGARAAPELARALADPFVSVQASAVEGLGAAGSTDPAFLAFLLDLFEGKLQARVSAAAQRGTARQFSLELSEHYRLLVAGCAAVANLARRGGMDLSEFEPPLMRSLKKSDGALVSMAQRLLGKGPELDQSEEQRIASAMALVTALAWIGTAQCLPVLRDVGKHAVPRVASLAERAIEEIMARMA